jgi:spermidine/putrescine transport system ATP-binding protein
VDNAVAIEARAVSKVFNSGTEHSVTALDNVSASIQDNEFFTLLGPSGCGKTTLLRLIAGFEHPTDGLIHLNGEVISHLPPNKRPVNMVFQNYALFPHLTVSGNIAFGLEMLDRDKTEVEKTVVEMLGLVRMKELATRKISQLSGGQAQRVALARALAPKPKVLLLDEPLSALDRKLRKKMQIELKRLQNETGITFIFVTHDQEEALTMSDRVAVMNEGRILQVGTPKEVYDHPSERFVATFIGESNLLEAELIGKEGDMGKVKLSSGAVLSASLPDPTVPTGSASIGIRPEHAQIVAGEKDAVLKGCIENIVYSGTDTHYHLRLDNSEPFVTRQQNRPDSRDEFKIGDTLGIAIRENAIQVLLD